MIATTGITLAPGEYPHIAVQCKQCHAYYVHYGITATWTWVNGRGPYCEKCMKHGVTVIADRTELP